MTPSQEIDEKHTDVYTIGIMTMDGEAEFQSFEWDENKNEINQRKHGIDFLQAARALQKPHVTLPSDRDGEARTLAICPDSARLIAVVYTMRGERCRIISARAARKNEQRAYRQLYD